MKRCSTSLATREMQFRTTMNHLLTPVRTAVISRTSHNEFRGCGGKGALVPCWWECKLVQPRWKTVRQSLKKSRIELLCDPATPLLRVYLENSKHVFTERCALLRALQHYPWGQRHGDPTAACARADAVQMYEGHCPVTRQKCCRWLQLGRAWGVPR